ncbi:monooxygenase [Coprinopsis sp. MPI-PUGE-AT-0042]|nr:monooxygenase [Coprinopsis sp. MPI-PUGE-AT-0042]
MRRQNPLEERGGITPIRLSTDLNPNWNKRYATQPELREYWDGLWKKYNLSSHTRLGVSVVFSEWNEKEQRWRITLKDVSSEKKEMVEAEVLFYGVGGFTAPKFPSDVAGLDRFKGDMFHSSQWRHDVELKGKKVGVIGNGCSAAQFIPSISEDPSVEVVNFARTPQWYVPKRDASYSPLTKWIFANVPGAMWCHRYWLFLNADLSFLIFNKGNKTIVGQTQKTLERYIRQKAPKEYADQLVPNYLPGCKRIIVDPGYLKCLHRPNVTLEWGRIDCIVEEGIKLKTGEVIPLDVIIFGTGYSREPLSLNIRGREGNLITDYFESKQGPTAYLGQCYPGFPNMFTFLGPNVVGGHYSVIFVEEAQIKHSLQLIKPILEGKVQTIEVTEEATESYNEWLQKRLTSTVYTDCDSYYFEHVEKADGKKVKGKNTATFPGPATLFYWLNRRPQWERFRISGAKPGWRPPGARTVQLALLAASVLLAALLPTFLHRH